MAFSDIPSDFHDKQQVPASFVRKNALLGSIFKLISLNVQQLIGKPDIHWYVSSSDGIMGNVRMTI